MKACNQIGFISTLIPFDDKVAEQRLLEKIEELNEDMSVDGILVQIATACPFLKKNHWIYISPLKDVDGFHPENIGRMVLGEKEAFYFLHAYRYYAFAGATKYLQKGKHAVIIGRSHIVGRPLSILWSNNSKPGNCTVTVCHSKTINLKKFAFRRILLWYNGRSKISESRYMEWKEGAVVIEQWASPEFRMRERRKDTEL